jgi:hypothetical protein
MALGQLMQIAIFIGTQTEHAANDRFAAVILAHSSTGFGRVLPVAAKLPVSIRTGPMRTAPSGQ